MKHFFTLILILCFVQDLAGQARIGLNNQVFLIIENGGKLVIDNNQPDALFTPQGDGRIISEGEFNEVIWNIENQTGAYTVPFYSRPLAQGGFEQPVGMTLQILSPGSSDGSIHFSTYQTLTDQNQLYPTPVADMINLAVAADVSLNTVDRFWFTKNSTYTIKPAVEMTIQYNELPEEAGGTNIINEATLEAYCWEESGGQWSSTGNGNADPPNNLVENVLLNPAEFWQVWTLMDINTYIALPVVLLDQSIGLDQCHMRMEWSVGSEQNCAYYEIYGTEDGSNWNSLALIEARNEFGVQHYGKTLSDVQSTRLKYFKIRQVDMDGKYTDFPVLELKESCNPEAVRCYPNPTNSTVHLETKGAGEFRVLNLLGQELIAPTSFYAHHIVSLADYPPGEYIIWINSHAFKLMKL